MTITIGLWIIPVIATLGFIFWPYKKEGGGGFDIWPAFSALLRIIGILIVWLVYFTIAYFLK